MSGGLTSTTPTRVGVVLLIVAAMLYSAVSLPAHFGNFWIAEAYTIVALLAGLTWTVTTWRLRSFDRAAAAGLSLVAGAVSLFWPALEVSFQHIDGGGLPPSENAVFLASILSSLTAVGTAVATLTRPLLAFRLLAVACIVSAIAGLLAPADPPSAREALALGLPLLIAAAAAQWLARRRSG